MRRYVDEGFVEHDNLEDNALGGGVIEITGAIRCRGGIRVDVDKILSVIGDNDDEPPLVQTTSYSYNASLDGVWNIVRYCSPHAGHNEFHHRHSYDVFGGDRTGTISRVGDDDWPTLGELLEELRVWASANAALN